MTPGPSPDETPAAPRSKLGVTQPLPLEWPNWLRFSYAFLGSIAGLGFGCCWFPIGLTEIDVVLIVPLLAFLGGGIGFAVDVAVAHASRGGPP